MKDKNKKIYLTVTLVVMILLLVVTISYAYYRIEATRENQTVSITTGRARITFKDNDVGITGKLTFGESITKNFTIENTGTIDASILLLWVDLINTYTAGSLTYTLEYSQTESGDYTEVIKDKNVPHTETPKREVLIDKVIVPVGQKYYYNLVITLNYLENVNQDADLDAEFSSYFGAEDVNYDPANTHIIDGIIASSKGNVLDFKIPSPKGTMTVNTANKYTNFASIENDSTYPFEYNDGLFVSTNDVNYSDSTITFSPNDTKEYAICFPNYPSNSDTLVTVYIDDIYSNIGKVTTESMSLSGKCSSLGIIGNDNKIKIIVREEGTPSNTRTNFFLTDDLSFTEDTDSGIYSLDDDYGTSYFYRGAVENNYVKFGKNKSGQDMWWRIIRVNGDGSLRLFYSGTQGYINGRVNHETVIQENVYNSSDKDNKYLGWMYGPAGTAASTSKEEAVLNVESSNAKKIVDAWYKENIVDTGFETYVGDALFCNDRWAPGKSISGMSSDTGLGYGSNRTIYSATVRFQSYYQNGAFMPTFKCQNKSDAFTVSDTVRGNGALTYPVGLITADEIVAAGSGKAIYMNTKYFLYNGNTYYSMTPREEYLLHSVSPEGSLSCANIKYSNSLIPVINISATYANKLLGSGTINDPYRLNI